MAPEIRKAPHWQQSKEKIMKPILCTSGMDSPFFIHALLKVGA